MQIYTDYKEIRTDQKVQYTLYQGKSLDLMVKSIALRVLGAIVVAAACLAPSIFGLIVGVMCIERGLALRKSVTTTVYQCPHHAKYGEVNISVQQNAKGLEIGITTEHLKLLSVNGREYDTPLIALYGDEKVNHFVGSGDTLKPEAVNEKIKRWNKRWSEKNPLSGYVILEKETNEFVGQFILKPLKDKQAGPGKFIEGVVELGYLSAEKHWNKNYAHESGHAIINHLIPHLIHSGYLAGITSVMATTRTDNVVVKRGCEKFMTHTGTKERYGAPREWFQHNY